MGSPILLVHGSFHNGECWDHLMPHLAGLGMEAHALTLGGHRGNPKPAAEVSMQTYAQDVIDYAEQLSARPVLIGHSMGGLVISEAADRRPELFSMLIYLTALVPPPGQISVRDLPGVSEKMVAAITSGLEISPDGTGAFPRETARDVFYNHCAADVQDAALARLSRQPLGAGIGAINTTREGLGSVRKHYIECLDDQALPMDSQRAMQSNAEFRSIHALASDHSPFFSMPAELARLIAKIAEE